MTDDAAVNASGLAMDDKPLIVAVDFDGTIVEHDYPRIGPPIPDALGWLRRFNSEGIKIILWTMRSGKELQDAVSYLVEAGVMLWDVNENPEQSFWTESPKAFAHIYVDDSSIGCPLLDGENNPRPMADWDMIGMEVLKRVRATRNANPPLSAMGALYGFVSWLTTRPAELRVGSLHDASEIVGLLGQFCVANTLVCGCGSDFPWNIVIPKEIKPQGSGMRVDDSAPPIEGCDVGDTTQELEP